MKKALAALVLFSLLAPAAAFAADSLANPTPTTPILPGITSQNAPNADITGGLVPAPTGCRSDDTNCIKALNEGSNPGQGYTLCDLRTLANRIISYAVVLSVFVATLMFAYGGMLYISAPAGGEGQLKKAHSVFTSVFVGLVVILVAWLVVNIVVSVLTGGNITSWTSWFGTGVQCTQLKAQPFSQVNTQSTVGPSGTAVPLTTGTLSNTDALNQLHAAGVCGTKYSCLKAGASLQGIRQTTIDGLVSLHQKCNCEFTITSGTDGSHSGGDYSHANGFKVDIRTSDNPTLTSFIEGGGGFTGPVSIVWGGVPSQQYTDQCGNKYTNEGDHWDVGFVNTCGG